MNTVSVKTEAHPTIITLDGPAGVGKSTLARRLAQALGLAYLDTGAMFRAVALLLAPELAGTPHTDDNAPSGYGEIEERLHQLFAEDSFSLVGTGEKTRLLYKGEALDPAIRSEETSMLAAKAGTVPAIREYLKKAQRSLGSGTSMVAEGRDMGTIVFPDAQCKFFLDADPRVRAERRLLQLRAMGEDANLDSLAEQIAARDAQDRNRAIAPLHPAADAKIIDTSHLDVEDAMCLLLRRVAVSGASFSSVSMRRKEKAMPEHEAYELLDRGEYGLLSLVCPDGQPYCVPLSYVRMEKTLYFHCARDGRKIRAMAHEKRCCFAVVGDTKPFYIKDFSTYYESTVVTGRVREVMDDDERYRVLAKLASKYLPEYMDRADGDIRRYFSRTAVYAIRIEQISGKATRPKQD